MDDIEKLDKEIRHYIYKTFSVTTRPPTTEEISKHYNITISTVEESYKRLANSHQIALAPGSYSIWMAHPFSSLPTNFRVEVGSNRYFAN